MMIIIIIILKVPHLLGLKAISTADRLTTGREQQLDLAVGTKHNTGKEALPRRRLFDHAPLNLALF